MLGLCMKVSHEGTVISQILSIFEYFQYLQSPDRWFSGNTLHFRTDNNTKVMISGLV